MPYQMMDILRFAPYALFLAVVFAVLFAAAAYSFWIIRRNAVRSEKSRQMPLIKVKTS